MTICWRVTGFMMKYHHEREWQGVLIVEDLNPEQTIVAAVSRWEMFKIGLKCILASVLCDRR